MAVISLICKQCDGQCDFDETKEFGFCSACGTKLIIKSDIIQNTYVQHTHVTKNIYGGKDVDEMIDNAVKLFELGQTEKAYNLLEKATEEDPKNWKAWFHLGAYKTAYLCADDEGKDFVFGTIIERTELRYLKEDIDTFREKDKRKIKELQAIVDINAAQKKQRQNEYNDRCKAVARDKKYMKCFTTSHDGAVIRRIKLKKDINVIIPYGVKAISPWDNDDIVADARLLIVPSTVELIEGWAFNRAKIKEAVFVGKTIFDEELFKKNIKKITKLS